ncbi:radical SAM protein [Spirochaeta cellobiosiphila]|uniref:radical SAM protein n=1 Tax=Spirochaeta cellobiosiphila TaxID=504483 RepID=UPI0004207B9D|nr:radical SAM protein [Spirochaeta cellobiosiphila]
MSKKHPCFNKKDHATSARVHIPVAPKCNVQCNFCNRKYDCVNESRPGVTSAVLTPLQALEYFKEVKEKLSNLAVVGIAGPGDPMANPEATIETFRLIREEDPDMTFCLSTNGLALAEHIDELKTVGVSHLTITMNGLDEQILADTYSWIRPKVKIFRGLAAGQEIKRRQLEALDAALAAGFEIKINTILLPGVNDKEIPKLAEFLKDKGVKVHNILPLKPVEGTPFGVLEEPSRELIHQVRSEAQKFLPQMTHCMRCRADAVGLLGQKSPEELVQALIKASMGVPRKTRPYVGVTSREGFLVNEHLGEATHIRIYKYEDGRTVPVERRASPGKGTGNDRWEALAELLKDCAALLVSGIGPKPQKVLTQSGIAIHMMEGLISEGVERIYTSKSMDSLKPRQAFSCGSSCQGTAQGCG